MILKTIFSIILISMIAAKQVHLQTFQLMNGGDVVDLSGEEAAIEFTDSHFEFTRKCENQDECDGLVKSLEAYGNATVFDRHVKFTFENTNITGKRMIRRGEFGDVYALLLKEGSVEQAQLNIMTAKGDAESDDFYNTITAITKANFLQ